MELSIFLAKLLGLYLLLMSLDLLIRRKELESAMKDFVSSKGLLFYSGSLSMVVGLAIIIGHPIYTLTWQGLITLIGYLLIVRGFARAAFPSVLNKRFYRFFHKRYWLLFIVLLVLGAYLTYSGFTASPMAMK